LIAAAVFANGFYSFARGETGTAVNVGPSRRAGSAPPAGTIAPIILGDSLARGTGDETGLGIGGRLVDDLRQRKIKTNNIVNLAVNGSRTADLLQLLESHNVQVLLAESNVIIVSIGGNDLWGDNFRNAPAADPEKILDSVLVQIARTVTAIRSANPTARIFVIGLYNPFGSTPMGGMLTALVSEWNAKLIEKFARDPNVVIVQTSDIFRWRDRLSLDQFHPGDEGYALIARRISDTF
jgi:lysophospholipase L1-like esterase